MIILQTYKDITSVETAIHIPATLIEIEGNHK